mmetsp:Transcript_9143/g.20399  ORF Transcript_9143/g.20399 Transcript_9143/m.20399 type:complete len:245 (+) Transcript_9143:610-1344(+)
MDSSRSTDDTSLSNLNNFTLSRNLPILQFISKQVLQFFSSISNSTRIPQHRWSIIKCSTCHDHILQLNLITRTHDCQVRNAPQICQIVTSMMSRSIISDHTCSIQDHSHGQILNGNIMDDLIIPTLHEGRVDAAKGLEALTSHTGSKGDGMLFGNSHIVGTLRETTSKYVHTSSSGHGGGDTHNGTIFGGSINHGIGEDGSKGGRGSLALDLNTSGDVEFTHTVHLITGCQGRRVSLALVRLDV